MKPRALGTAAALRVFWRSGLLEIRQHMLLTCSAFFMLIVAAASLVFYEVEDSGQNALWRSVVYIVSGLDVAQPETTAGKIAATVVLVSGVIFVSLLTGYVASMFSRLILFSHAVPAKPLTRVLQNHAVIFGWGRKTRAILRELNADPTVRVNDFVIVSEDQHIAKGDERIYRNVWHTRGAAGDMETLRHADLTPHRGRGAAVAALVADADLRPAEADRRTLLQLLAVEHSFPEVVSLAEARCAESCEHFSNAYADQVVVPGEYSGSLLARTSEFHGLAAYFEDLLSLAPAADLQGAAEPVSPYVRSAAELGVVGKTFGEAVIDYYQRKNGIITGTIANDGFCLFPDLEERDAGRLLAAADALVVIGRLDQV